MELRIAIDLFLSQYIPTSADSYKWALKPLVEFLEPRSSIQKVKPEDMLAYDRLLKQRDISRATIAKYVNSAKIFFNWLVKQELIKKSPARFLKVQKQADAVERERAMTDKELALLLDFAKWDKRDYALILFLADTGCRAGGAAGLRESDINWEKNEATVTEKGAKTRLVAFGSRCAQAVREWLEYREATEGNYVFSDTGRKMLSASLSKIVRRNCQAVGIRSLGSHSLRHRKGHQLGDERVAPTLAARALGHSNAETTMRYYYRRDWDKTAEILRDLAVPDEPPKLTVLKKHKSS